MTRIITVSWEKRPAKEKVDTYQIGLRMILGPWNWKPIKVFSEGSFMFGEYEVIYEGPGLQDAEQEHRIFEIIEVDPTSKWFRSIEIGMTYEVAIRAINVNGKVGKWSKPIRIEPGGYPSRVFFRPFEINERGNLVVQWDPVLGEGVTEYVITFARCADPSIRFFDMMLKPGWDKPGKNAIWDKARLEGFHIGSSKMDHRSLWDSWSSETVNYLQKTTEEEAMPKEPLVAGLARAERRVEGETRYGIEGYDESGPFRVGVKKVARTASSGGTVARPGIVSRVAHGAGEGIGHLGHATRIVSHAIGSGVSKMIPSRTGYSADRLKSTVSRFTAWVDFNFIRSKWGNTFVVRGEQSDHFEIAKQDLGFDLYRGVPYVFTIYAKNDFGYSRRATVEILSRQRFDPRERNEWFEMVEGISHSTQASLQILKEYDDGRGARTKRLREIADLHLKEYKNVKKDKDKLNDYARVYISALLLEDDPHDVKRRLTECKTEIDQMFGKLDNDTKNIKDPKYPQYTLESYHRGLDNAYFQSFQHLDSVKDELRRMLGSKWIQVTKDNRIILKKNWDGLVKMGATDELIKILDEGFLKHVQDFLRYYARIDFIIHQLMIGPETKA